MEEAHSPSAWTKLGVRILVTALTGLGLYGICVSYFTPDFLPSLQKGIASSLASRQANGVVQIGNPYLFRYIGNAGNLLAGLMAGGLALSLAWSRDRSPAGSLLAILLGVWTLLAGESSLGLTSAQQNHLNEGACVLFSILLLRLGAHFPVSLRPRDLEEHSAARGGKYRRIHRVLLNPLWVWGWGPFYLLFRPLLSVSWFPWMVLRVLQAINLILAPVSLVLCAGYMKVGYELADPERRRQVRWILAGVMVLIWTYLFWPLGLILESHWNIRVDELFDAIGSAGELAFVLSVGFCVFFRGAFDPRLVIRATTLWGVTGAIVFFIFGGVEVAVSDFALTQIGLPQGLGPWIAGGMAAAAFGPVRVRVRKSVDQFIDERLPATILVTGARGEAVVVFCDMVGYTRLSQEDEPSALTLVTVLQKAARRAANRHQGRLVKTIGDAVLLEFQTADGALRGVRMLEDSYQTTAEVLNLAPPPLRTGVHFGEVARSRDGDILGDTVNIASRLQGAAEPGQVVLSFAARTQLTPGEFELDPLEAKVLKNVGDAVDCFSLR